MPKKSNKIVIIIGIISAVVLVGYLVIGFVDNYLWERSLQKSSSCSKNQIRIIDYAKSSNPAFRNCYEDWGEREYLLEHGEGVNTNIAIYCAERLNDVQLYKSLTEDCQ